MSKIENFKRLIPEDYKSTEQELINKLGNSINTFAEQVTNAFNNNLSIDDNLNITKRSLTITVDSNGVPLVPTNINSGLNGTCVGIQVIRAQNVTNSSIIPTGTPFISYADNSRVIKISNITNLQANNKYQLNLILYT